MPGGTAAAMGPQQPQPNEAILKAIEAAEGKGVTVAGVVAATGLPTDVVEAEMAALLRGAFQHACCAMGYGLIGRSIGRFDRPKSGPAEST
jgi:hypothetical protein